MYEVEEGGVGLTFITLQKEQEMRIFVASQSMNATSVNSSTS